MQLVADSAYVKIPATIAHLGSALDSAALCLSLFDEIEVRATAGETRIVLDGEGVHSSPRDVTHPTVIALRHALETVGAPLVGVHIHARNRIPRGQGLGAEEGETLAGLLAAQVFLGTDLFPTDALEKLAVTMGLSPLRVQAAMKASAIITFGALSDEGKTRQPFHTVTLIPPPAIEPVLFVPGYSTAPAEVGVGLPHAVPLSHAAYNCARSALLGALLSGAEIGGSPEGYRQLLVEATADALHQNHRLALSPASFSLMEWLRGMDVPAVLSDGGPTVVSLCSVSREILLAAKRAGWLVAPTQISRSGAFAHPLSRSAE